MKSYQGLFAQALYLAAKPLDKAERQKLDNASGQDQIPSDSPKNKAS
ncbi:hypothetical protein [uncultured Shewanella sp.]|nr:hypothetical protein [uncultured Shewanella sp.]